MSDVMRWRGLRLFLLALGVAAGLWAQTPSDPYFIGFSDEPAMESGGRSLLSLDRGVCRLLGSNDGSKGYPAAAWEAPLGMLLTMVVNHEFDGHGGRAREFHLDPRYEAKFDLSAGTGIQVMPQSNFQVACLALGGTEADSVTALRLQRDLLRPGGAEGATLPALLFAKLDMSLYVGLAPSLNSVKFPDEFSKGNDIVVWLIARQAMRKGSDPVALWNRTLTLDLGDPLLQKNLDAARATAIWNLLDPAVASSVWQYVTEHLGQRHPRVEPRMLDLGGGCALMVGAHGSLGPADVSRYIDLYLRTPLGLMYAYARDLDSSVDRTHGVGLGIHDLALGPRIRVSLSGDQWQEPLALERPARNSQGWNVAGELQALFGTPAPRHLALGLSLQAGRKSAGFLPGRPIGAGSYLGGGLLVSF